MKQGDIIKIKVKEVFFNKWNGILNSISLLSENNDEFKILKRQFKLLLGDVDYNNFISVKKNLIGKAFIGKIFWHGICSGNFLDLNYKNNEWD